MWAKANGITHRYSGIVRGEVENSGEAELCAIANGLYVVFKRFVPPAGSKIICETDSREAIRAIQIQQHPRPHARLIAKSIKSFASQRNWILDLRYVKGHLGIETKRNAVNTWCDRECRRLIRDNFADFKSEIMEIQDTWTGEACVKCNGTDFELDLALDLDDQIVCERCLKCGAIRPKQVTKDYPIVGKTTK